MLHSNSRREMVCVILLSILAIFARLDQIGISTFQYDEGSLSAFATNWLQGGPLPQRGVLASVGLPTGPLSIYLLAIPYLLFSTPLAATAFIALLNIGGVMALWAFARRAFNPTVALVAGLAYAVSPWAVLYSRKIWNPNFYSPFLLASVLCAWLGVGEKRRPWAQCLAVVLILVMPQFHYQPWLLMPVVMIIFWQGRRNIAWPAVGLGVLIAFLLWLPFITSLSQEDITVFQSFSKDSAARSFAPRLDPWEMVADFVTGWQVDVPLVGETAAREIRTQVPMPTVLWGLLLIPFGIGVLTAWRRYGARSLLVYVWVGITPLLFTPSWIQIHDHYFTLILPGLFLFVGFGLDQIIERGQRRAVVQGLAAGGLLIVLLSQLLWWRAFLQHIDQTYHEFYFGTPLHYLMDIRAALQPYDDVLILGGDAFRTTDSSIWKPLLHGQTRCVRDLVIAGGNVAVLPDHPFAVLLASYPAPYSLRDFYTQTAAQVMPLRPGEDPYTIYTWDAAPAWTEPTITPVTAPVFENGVRLTGYAFTAESLYLQWHIDAADSRDNVQYFAHFFNAAGEKIGQRDSSFYDVQYWCAGDTIITRVDTAIPAETVKLGVGMYRLVEGKARGLSAVDEAGNPASGTIEINVSEQ